MSTVRVDDETHAVLREVARFEGLSMQDLLKKVLEEYRRRSILEATNRAYGAIRERKRDRGELDGEREAWNGILTDGLEEDQ